MNSRLPSAGFQSLMCLMVVGCSAAKNIEPKLMQCENLSSGEIQVSSTPLTTLIANNSDGYRFVLQYDADMGFVDGIGLNLGESITIDTAGEQRWMITDGPGNCLAVLDGPLGESYSITVENQDFGPE